MSLEIYAFCALALVIIVLFVWIIWLQNKLGRLLVGKSKNLDDSFSSLEKDIKDLKKFQGQAEKTFVNHDERLKRAITGVETVRFNPFKGDGSGGNQSFATAFINEDHDGVIISSMYSRDHVSIFAKPIQTSKSEYELTNEEREALNKAEKAIK